MNTLKTIRIKSFLYSGGSVVLVAILGALVSPDFLSLLQEYTGTAFWGTLVSLIVAEILKALRNYKIQKEIPMTGGSEKKMFF